MAPTQPYREGGRGQALQGGGRGLDMNTNWPHRGIKGLDLALEEERDMAQPQPSPAAWKEVWLSFNLAPCGEGGMARP